MAQATYQSLMDQMGYEARLANTRAQQAMKQAETAVRAAQERLRILGVKPDGTEPEVEGGKVVGVKPDGTLPAPPDEGAAAAAESPRRSSRTDDGEGGRRAGRRPPRCGAEPKDAPVSTYSIWAPFDGTILDREMIVPGRRRRHDPPDLHDGQPGDGLGRGEHPRERLRHARPQPRGRRSGSGRRPTPSRVFEGEVIYTGDLVEEKSRTVKLLAQAENPDRLLKPGMFVEVEVLSPRGQDRPAGPGLGAADRGEPHVRLRPDRPRPVRTPRGRRRAPPRATRRSSAAASSPATRSSSRAASSSSRMAVQLASAGR